MELKIIPTESAYTHVALSGRLDIDGKKLYARKREHHPRIKAISGKR